MVFRQRPSVPVTYLSAMLVLLDVVLDAVEADDDAAELVAFLGEQKAELDAEAMLGHKNSGGELEEVRG